jgi:hypothetical protein
VKEATDVYYHNLREAEISDAWWHWDQVYADVLPIKLLETFKQVYGTYSPYYEEQAFVVGPWKPGPFWFMKHAPKPLKFSLPFLPKTVPFTRTQRSDLLPARTSESCSPVCGKAADSRNTPTPLGRHDLSAGVN